MDRSALQRVKINRFGMYVCELKQQGVFDVRFHCRGLQGSGDVAVKALRLPDVTLSKSSSSVSSGRKIEPRRSRIVPRSIGEAAVSEAPASSTSAAAAVTVAKDTGALSAGATTPGEGHTESANLERWRITHSSVETKKVELPFQLRPDDVVTCHRTTL